MKSSDMSTKVAPMRSAIPASARVTSASAPRKMRLPSTLARISERYRGLVDAEDDPGVVLDLALVAVRRILDLTLHEGNRGHRAAQIVDLLDVHARRLLDLARQMLDGEGAAERIGDVGDARLVREDLLGP